MSYLKLKSESEVKAFEPVLQFTVLIKFINHSIN